MSNPKYHHLIPQTYMKAWCFNNKSIYIAKKEKLSKVETKNIERIGGIQNYHTIKAGMVCCQKEDADLIFNVTKDYIIKFNNKVISDTYELNKIYCYFNEWEVTYLDGKLASKKKLKNDIERVGIKDIELLWSQIYESGWNLQLQKVNDIILRAKNNTIVTEFDKDYLMKFFVALDWRSFHSNNNFNNSYNDIARDFKSIVIPEEERIYPFLETAYKELYHCSLLKKYREFLNGAGVIYNTALQLIERTQFHFYVADGTSTFITSDNPAFAFTRLEDGLNQGILPISPKILMIIGKNPTRESQYYISKVTDNIVKRYNKLILDNAVDFIILDDPEKEYF